MLRSAEKTDNLKILHSVGMRRSVEKTDNSQTLHSVGMQPTSIMQSLKIN